MIMRDYRRGRLLILGLAAVALIGCTNDQIAQERDRLANENLELRSALGRAEDDRNSAEGDRNRLVSEINRLQQERDNRAAVAKSNTGFEVIPGVEVHRDQGAIKVGVPGDVLFSPGKATLKHAAKLTLDQIATVINSQYGRNTIGVEGHTDTDPIRKSKWADNLELSVQRAAAVHRYLQQKGIDSKQMYAAGWADAQPRSSKAKSRRVEIVALSS